LATILWEVSEELWNVAMVVADNQVFVIAHRDEAVERDAITRHRFAEAVEKDLLDHAFGTKQQLPLRAPPREQVRAHGQHLARDRHVTFLDANTRASQSTPCATSELEQSRDLAAMSPWPGQMGLWPGTPEQQARGYAAEPHARAAHRWPRHRATSARRSTTASRSRKT
jgi:hypothetical protein